MSGSQHKGDLFPQRDKGQVVQGKHGRQDEEEGERNKGEWKGVFVSGLGNKELPVDREETDRCVL